MRVFFSLLLVFACSVPAFADPEKKEPLGSFKITYYWTAVEKAGSEPRSETLLDPEGKSLGKFTRSFVRALRLEGSAITRDGRVLNVAGKKDGIPRFRVVDVPYGLGSRNNALVPFRSVATDPKVVPYGTVLFIPKAVGAKLPDGTIHDGYFTAADVGGGIRGRHLDIFTGIGDQRGCLTRNGVKNLRRTPIFKVTGGPKRPELTTPSRKSRAQ